MSPNAKYNIHAPTFEHRVLEAHATEEGAEQLEADLQEAGGEGFAVVGVVPASTASEPSLVLLQRQVGVRLVACDPNAPAPEEPAEPVS